MRKSAILFICGLVILLSSCTDMADRRAISKLRELSVCNPDSVLFILEVSFHPRLMSDANVAEWCMLNSQLLDTLKRPIDVDTTFLRRTVSYYRADEKPEQAARAGLYLGHAYAEKKDYNSAVNAYLSALDLSKATGSHNQTGYISSYLADLYSEEWRYKDAERLYKQASEYFQKTNNRKSYGIALRDMGQMCMMQTRNEEALQLCLKADSIAHELKDTVFIYSMANYKGVVYKDLKQYDLARKYLLESLTYCLDSSYSHLALSDLYLQMGKIKDAFLYLDKYNKDKDTYPQTNYWNQKYKIFKKINSVDSALYCLEQYNIYADSIWEEEDNLYVSEIGKKYDYSKIEDENILLSHQLQIRFVFILLLVLLCLLLYLIYTRKIDRKNREIQLKQTELNMADVRRKWKDIESREQNLELQRREDELKLLKNKEHLAKQNLLKRSLIFKKIRMLSELRTNNPQAFKEEVEKILKSSTLSEADWKNIKEEINDVYIQFTDKLLLEVPNFTEEEVRFCCLLKIGLNTSELATLLDINTTSVDRRRARINKKIREVYPDSSWEDMLVKL